MPDNGDLITEYANKHRFASEVGWLFLKEYYKICCVQPEMIYKFYKKCSSVSHGLECDSVIPCVGKVSIKNVTDKFNFEGKRIILSTIDTHSSCNDSIIIMVVGEIRTAEGNEPPRKFVQTFFLASQHNGFYILNDIFRYIKYDTDENWENAVEDALDSEAYVEATSAPPTVDALFDKNAKVEQKTQQQQVPPKVHDAVKPTTVDIPTSASSSHNTFVHPPLKPAAISQEPESSQDTQPDKQQPTCTEPRPDTVTTNSSVKLNANSSENASSTLQNSTSAPMKPSYASCAAVSGPPNPTTQVAPQPPAMQKKRLKKAPTNGSSAMYYSNAHNNRDGQHPSHKGYNSNTRKDDHHQPNEKNSVFVRIASDGFITKEKLQNALSKYGPVVTQTIIPNLCCAFVEFADQASVVNAIGQSLTIEGTTIQIEERKKSDKSGRGHQKPYKAFHPDRNEESQDSHSTQKPYHHYKQPSRAPHSTSEKPNFSTNQSESYHQYPHEPSNKKPSRNDNPTQDSDKYNSQSKLKKSSASGPKKATA